MLKEQIKAYSGVAASNEMTMSRQRTGVVRVKAQTTIALRTHEAVTSFHAFVGILHCNKSSRLATNSKLEWQLQFA